MWESSFALSKGARESQQDRVRIFQAPDKTITLAILADGMGGQAFGDLAAEIAVRAAEECWRRLATESRAASDLLRDILALADKEICAASNRLNADAGSTCTILYLDDNGACWTSVGDSRLYRFRGGEFRAKTTDDTVGQLLVDTGKLQEQDLETSPEAHLLTHGLGGRMPRKIEMDRAAVERGDGYILCSDGVWSQLSLEELTLALRSQDLNAAAQNLVSTATQRGGDHADNASVVLLRFGLSVAKA